MPRSSKRISKKQIGCSMKGGDASNHAISTYGGIGEQSASNGNLINMKGGEPQPNSSVSEPGTPFIKGGYRNKTKSKSPRKGGSVSGLFVPAALLYGQQMAIRRSKKRGGSRRTKSAKRKH
jgi:hypothetical protein